MWRTAPLPPDWRAIRREALARDGYRCTWFPLSALDGSDYTQSYTHPYRCVQQATDVDHIFSNYDHSINNLRSLCKQHHSSKTSAFAHKLNHSRVKQQMRVNSGKSLKHPGLL